MSIDSTPQRSIGAGALSGISTQVAQYLPGQRLLLVCDDMTWVAAGEQVRAQLVEGPVLTLHTLGKRAKAAKLAADDLTELAGEHDALLAVGSGTINDLAKFAAATANKPYGVVATAASMNGYTAANASLEADGFKHSFAARPPKFVVADSHIIANAPKRLTRAGLGDTLCRSTVEADMLMSHRLLGAPYPRQLFDGLRKHEATLLSGLMAHREAESDFIDTLMTALLDAGDAMTLHGSSAVASQGEHMIAHTLELKYGAELHDLLHGELIALTCHTMSQMQARVLLSTPQVRPMPVEMEQFERRFSKQIAAFLYAAYGKKLLNEEQAAAINAKIAVEWPEIKAELEAIMVPPNTLERAFIHSGIHTKASQIGLDEERYRFGVSYAHMTRERFTFLDLAAMGIKRMR
ncbi:MAG: iron-containing alcohol dehydrogenase [Rickettsiales bacterium]